MAQLGKSEIDKKNGEANLNQTELNNRQKDLDNHEADIIKRLEKIRKQENDLANRELAVTQANQEEALRLRELADNLARQRQSLENEKAALFKREQDVIAAEEKRDAGYAEERFAFDAELRSKKAKDDAQITEIYENKLSALEDEITKLKTKRLEDIAKAGQAERELIQSEIARERDIWLKEQEEGRKQLSAERTELERQKGAVSALQSEIEGHKTELESAERLLERKEERLERQWQKRNDELDDIIEAQLEEKRKSLEIINQSYRDDNTMLRESIRVQEELDRNYDHLKRLLGDKDPGEYIRELNSKADENKRLREELAVHPTEEMRERYKLLEEEANKKKALAEVYAKQIADNEVAVAETAAIKFKNSVLVSENEALKQKADIFEQQANWLKAELDRLRPDISPEEVQARYDDIEIPHIKKVKEPLEPKKIDEMTWIEGIDKACKNYGIYFNPRILKAFHTALKTAESSPLTILAGVSGTGKSELPRLYSHFGGIYFEPVAVQPVWDSQESMLGFFNSIDNKFDTQPVLRFLVQSQKPWVKESENEKGYPGLSHAVCLILLDEMNLAHPELYFAEFLSKLELRRGMKGSDVPSLPVKIGAGMEPYQLPLGRNVLWTGTMNQDETTKSLSDKVLDRSIIIHFPRPDKLKRRKKFEPLDDSNRGQVLHKAVWQSWLAQGSLFSDEEIEPFKGFIEDMNTALAVAGRAIGHRVWQSVEYYMANYPDVRVAKNRDDQKELSDAMHTAFEDQLVQKVMPKLRGIDTRGKSKTECLDKILEQINTGINKKPFSLAEDFNLACELGHGQFIWQSANYLKGSEHDSD